MTSMDAIDMTYCRFFLLTLGDQAYMWFKSLAPNSIEFFHQLASLFLNHFSTMVPRPAAKQIFMNIEQDSVDSDRDYIERVNKVLMEDEPIGDEVKIMGAVRGLRLNTKP